VGQISVAKRGHFSVAKNRAVADGIFHGTSLGLFMAVGGAAGAGYAYFNKNRFADVKVGGIKIGNRYLTIGPCKNIQIFYVLMDRILLYYSHTINWSHARREKSDINYIEKLKKIGFAAFFDSGTRKIFDRFFFQIIKAENFTKSNFSEKEVVLKIKEILIKISEDSFLNKNFLNKD
jgi:hypothetical protein